MCDKKLEQLKRIMELPCVRGNDDPLEISFTSRMIVSKEDMQSDPIAVMRMLTFRMQEECLAVFEEKHRVLDEIENGTNRYDIVGGRFENVGKEKA